MPEELAVGAVPSNDTAIISITNPGDVAPLQEGWDRFLRISFADASYDANHIRRAGNSWKSSSRGFPGKRHAQTIRAFLETMPQDISRLIVHCGAGKSRSAAVALYACRHYGITFVPGDSSPNQALLELLENPAVFDAALDSVSRPP